jgi:cytochrome P450
MTDVHEPPTRDWATEFDHTSDDYAAHAPEIWDDLRDRCPVAHGEAHGGVWFPARHADVSAIANDTDHFSSEGVIVSIFKPDGSLAPVGYAAPITADPPFHAGSRRALLPAFSPKAIDRWEPSTRENCRELLDALLADGATTADAAVQYAQEIPVRVIADMLGVPRSDGDRFRGFIHRIIEKPGTYTASIAPNETLDYYITSTLQRRRQEEPRDDLIGYLLDLRIDGHPLPDWQIVGTIGLLIIAGIDTTWSAIGASLWHLASHPEDRARLVAEPELLPFAVEEFLRFYAPVTMARIATDDVEVGGCPIKARDWVLLPFPSANRDPEAFERADEFVIDRQRNRHLAFGLGIHRCLGSNLARMELTVALEEWLARIPDFELADPAGVRWSTGQVRGPRELPVRILSQEA